MGWMTVSSVSLICLTWQAIIKNSDKSIEVFFHANISYVRFSNICLSHFYFSFFSLPVYHSSFFFICSLFIKNNFDNSKCSDTLFLHTFTHLIIPFVNHLDRNWSIKFHFWKIDIHISARLRFVFFRINLWEKVYLLNK